MGDGVGVGLSELGDAGLGEDAGVEGAEIAVSDSCGAALVADPALEPPQALTASPTVRHPATVITPRMLPP